jgi:uncharacterized delta-60 repeat protein
MRIPTVSDTAPTFFNNDGKVTTPIGSYDDWGQSVTLQPDGKILVAGYTWNGSDWDFALVRYNSDGSLDTSFDGDGKVTTPIGTSYDDAESVTLQPDGKILVAGHTQGSSWDFALARYNSDGSLDTTFGGSGKVTTPIGIDDAATLALTCYRRVHGYEDRAHRADHPPHAGRVGWLADPRARCSATSVSEHAALHMALPCSVGRASEVCGAATAWAAWSERGAAAENPWRMSVTLMLARVATKT